MRPYVLLSVATSIDGYIDDTEDGRLLLSNEEDFDRVDEVRASSDAIMVGAGTIRADNPRLLVNSDDRRARRVRDGKPEFPLKVAITGSGKLSRDLKFWHHGGEKIAYTTDVGEALLRDEIGDLATVRNLGSEISFPATLDDLGRRGVRQLMIEGGGSIHTAMLSQGLVDEIHMVVAPLLVGQSSAPRFLYPASYPGGSRARLGLIESRQIGDVTLVRFRPKERA